MQEALSDPVRIVVGTVGQANEDIRQEVLVLKASPLGVVSVGYWVGLGVDLVAGTGYHFRLFRRSLLTAFQQSQSKQDDSEKWGWLSKHLGGMVGAGKVLVFVSSKQGCVVICVALSALRRQSRDKGRRVSHSC